MSSLSTKTNTQNDAKTRTTPRRNRKLEQIVLCFSDFFFVLIISLKHITW